MDSFKHAIWLLVQERINTRWYEFVCVALRHAYEEVTGCEIALDDLPKEFPEFFDMHDGHTWFDERHSRNGKPSQAIGVPKQDHAWWTPWHKGREDTIRTVINSLR